MLNTLISYQIKNTFITQVADTKTLLQVLHYFNLTSNPELMMIEHKPFFQFFADKISNYNCKLFEQNKKFLEDTLKEIKSIVEKKTKQDKNLRIKEIEKNLKMIKKTGQKKYIEMIRRAASFDMKDQMKVDQDIRFFFYSLFGMKKKNVVESDKKLGKHNEISFKKKKNSLDDKSRISSLRESIKFNNSDHKNLTLGIELSKLAKSCQTEKDMKTEIKEIEKPKDLKLIQEGKLFKIPEKIFRDEYLRKCLDQKLASSEVIKELIGFMEKYHRYHISGINERWDHEENAKYFKVWRNFTLEFIDYLDNLRSLKDGESVLKFNFYDRAKNQYERFKRENRKSIDFGSLEEDSLYDTNPNQGLGDIYTPDRINSIPFENSADFDVDPLDFELELEEDNLFRNNRVNVNDNNLRGENGTQRSVGNQFEGMSDEPLPSLQTLNEDEEKEQSFESEDANDGDDGKVVDEDSLDRIFGIEKNNEAKVKSSNVFE